MPYVPALVGSVPAGSRASLPPLRNRYALHRHCDPHRPPRGWNPAEPLIEKNGFAIRVVDDMHADAVDTLVNNMYRQRGYRVSTERRNPAARTQAVTLEAVSGRTTIGTLTVNLGSQQGLNAEALYREEIAHARRPGRRPCEFNRLAMSMDESSKEALASIFHVGILFAFRIFAATDLFIEVNPRHAPFYRRKIGFAPAGEQKICPRVDAPAVLLHKNLAVCAEELSRLGGVRIPSNKSFYAFALTPAEERIVLGNIVSPLRRAS